MTKPPSTTILPWLRANLGKNCLAPLTGTDTKALLAAVQIIELYTYCKDDKVLEAFGRIVSCMQNHTQELAYHAVAHVMDWNDRGHVWDSAGLTLLIYPRKCAFE